MKKVRRVPPFALVVIPGAVAAAVTVTVVDDADAWRTVALCGSGHSLASLVDVYGLAKSRFLIPLTAISHNQYFSNYPIRHVLNPLVT